MATTSLRWGRIVLGGFLAEVLLIVAVIPMYAAGAGESAITVLALAGSFVAVALVAWWMCRPLPRPVLHGVLMGVAATLIYTAMSVAGRLADPTAPPIPLIYYVGHALKLAGGAAGSWLAARAASPATTTAGV
jgi:hypothetical protein